MIGVNDNKMYSNLLVFKFKNYELEYPQHIKDIIRFSSNSGDFKEFETINTLGQNDYRKIFVIGLGTTEEFNSVKLFKALGAAIVSLKEVIEDLDILDNLNEDLGYIIAQSLVLSLYKYKGIKQNETKEKLQQINVISTYKESINKGLIIGNSINFGRDLANMPSNYVTPKYLANQCEHIAKEDNLDIKILDKYTLEQLGMGGILSVAKGSIHSPRLIAMQYFGDPEDKNIIALIGKGVTFDSGGISIKQSKGMEKMISDMAGASTVISVAKAIGKLKPQKNLIILVPTVENMPSGTAFKPGDVITTYSGKTVEVISTDAEGRLILCDAITYAKELGATTIIDVATLTGSCANFFGGINIGLSSNSDELSKEIVDIGINTGENFWRLPNNVEYLDQLKTNNADLKNTGNNSGGIVAGLFLQSFAEDTDFAHLDIAGASAFITPTDGYDKGSNGYPARTLIEYILA